MHKNRGSEMSFGSALDELAAADDSISDAVLARIYVEVDGYGAVGGPSDESTEMVVRANIAMFLRAARRRSLPVGDELDVFVESARRQARNEHPLPMMLHAYRIGTRVTWERLADLTQQDRGVGLQDALALTGFIIQYVDMVSTAVAEAYVEERTLMRADAVEQHRRAFEAWSAGAPRPANIIRLVATESQPTPTVRNVIARLDHDDETTMLVADRDDLVIVLPDDGGPKPLRHWELLARERAARSVIVRHDGHHDVASCLDDARRMAGAIRTSPDDRAAHMVDIDQLLVTAIVEQWPGGAHRRLEQVCTTIDDADQVGRASLRSTILTLASSPSVTAAARSMHLHRNSVLWRMQRIRELTGFDPATTDGLIVLASAAQLG